jgi:hypothetical protein
MLSFISLTAEERAMLAHLLRDAAQFLDDDDLSNALRRVSSCGKSFYSIMAGRASTYGIDLNQMLRITITGTLADTIRLLFKEQK